MSENDGRFLTEETLGQYLDLVFRGHEIIHDRSLKRVVGFGYRPDYFIPDHRLVVEFDGYHHYQRAATVLNDAKKDVALADEGFMAIRIPYFIQLDTVTTTVLFGGHTDYLPGPELAGIGKYPHGFIDSRVLLPADYCQLGVDRFIMDLERFSAIKDAIVKSVRDQVERLGDWRLVVLETLRYLVD